MITRITVSGGTYVRVTTGVTVAQVQAMINAGGTTGIRADSSVISTGLEQFVEFSSSLNTVNYSLKIQSVPDLGIEYITKEQNGFTIKFVDEGLFDYVAIKNI